MFFVHRDLEKLSNGRKISDPTGVVKETLQNWEVSDLEYLSSNFWRVQFTKPIPNLRSLAVVRLSSDQRLATVCLSDLPYWSSCDLTLGTIDLEDVWSVKELLALAADIIRGQLETASRLFP